MTVLLFNHANPREYPQTLKACVSGNPCFENTVFIKLSHTF